MILNRHNNNAYITYLFNNFLLNFKKYYRELNFTSYNSISFSVKYLKIIIRKLCFDIKFLITYQTERFPKIIYINKIFDKLHKVRVLYCRY